MGKGSGKTGVGKGKDGIGSGEFLATMEWLEELEFREILSASKRGHIQSYVPGQPKQFFKVRQSLKVKLS